MVTYIHWLFTILTNEHQYACVRFKGAFHFESKYVCYVCICILYI